MKKFDYTNLINFRYSIALWQKSFRTLKVNINKTKFDLQNIWPKEKKPPKYLSACMKPRARASPPAASPLLRESSAHRIFPWSPFLRNSTVEFISLDCYSSSGETLLISWFFFLKVLVFLPLCSPKPFGLSCVSAHDITKLLGLRIWILQSRVGV